MKIMVTWAALCYWAGIFSGYYARQPAQCGPSTWNPDTYIHSALFVGSVYAFVDWVRNCHIAKVQNG